MIETRRKRTRERTRAKMRRNPGEENQRALTTRRVETTRTDQSLERAKKKPQAMAVESLLPKSLAIKTRDLPRKNQRMERSQRGTMTASLPRARGRGTATTIASLPRRRGREIAATIVNLPGTRRDRETTKNHPRGEAAAGARARAVVSLNLLKTVKRRRMTSQRGVETASLRRKTRRRRTTERRM